jgi:DNA-binding transcriptional regulator YhcF (GntR family)
VEAISDLPMLHDMDADYSPQYVKLARILRNKIESGQYKRGDPLPAAVLASEHKVSMRVVWHTMDMLAANKYVHRPGNFAAYVVTWQAGALCRGGNPERELSRASRQPSSARTSAPSARARDGPKATSAN